MNPGRGKKSEYQPARTTVAVLTYVPNTIGYFKNRFDVTRVCIESILRNTQEPYDLLIFDNGSRKEVVDYLRDLRGKGSIDFLILSAKNIGKIGALQIIFKAAPGEVIAYCDDDVFFLPGWLKAHLKILDTYPDVGAVTGFYIKPHMKSNVRATLRFAEREDALTERGNLVDPAQEAHYIRQTGRTRERYEEEIEGIADVRMRYQGVEAFASAGHHQLVANRQVLLDVLPTQWSGNLMGQMRELDGAIDGLGKLRLSTSPATTRLLGNLIDAQMAQEIRPYGIHIQASEGPGEIAGWKKSLLRTPLVQKIAYFFYERLFKIINT